MAATKTSGQEQSRASIERLQGYTVVDCDVHEIIPEVIRGEVLADYLDEPWAGKYRHTKRTDEPLAGTVGGTQPHDIDPTPHGLGDDVSPTNPDGLKAFMDRFESDFIVMHGHGIPAGTTDTVPDAEFAAALSSAYNDYVLDALLDEHDGFKASIHVSPHAPRAAAEEIDRLADEDDMVSVYLPAGPNGLFGNAEYDPIYEAANDHGLPVDYHPSQSMMPWSGLWGGPWVSSTAEFMGVYGHHMLAHVPNLVFEGIPERFPDVTHVFLEAGIAWLPWMLGRMDKNYERRKHDLPGLDRAPSEYLYEHFYFGTQPIEDVAGPGRLADLFGHIRAEELLVYSTDFPHFDFDYPAPQAIPELPDDVEERIFGGNAIEVYGL